MRVLWRLARPAGMPLVLGLPLWGFGYAHWEWGLMLRNPTGLALVLASWWFLSAGTLWLNAALDRDDGEVLMGPRTPVPPGIQRWGYAALIVAVALAVPAGPIPGAAAAIASGLAVLYSHPATAWKGHPVLGPGVNLVGYGLLSPLAGWSLVGSPPTVRTVASFAIVMVWVAATYLAAQAFQRREDADRGYRTLVVTHGPETVIHLCRALYGAAFWTAAGLAVLGFYPRLLLLAVPVWAVLDRHLALWARQPDGGDAGWGRGMLRRATVLAVTLMAVVTAQHAWAFYTGDLPAGLGTAWRPAP